MGAMPFAQHPAQKHREPACFCNGTFRVKASRAWPLLQWISCQEMPLGHDGRTLPVYCARFQVTRASCRVETGSR